MASFSLTEAAASSPFQLDAKEGWHLSFDPESSQLKCRHATAGVQLEGVLSFTAIRGDQRTAWKIELARDAVSSRLAIVDDRNDVQGYIAIGADAARFWLLPIHRPLDFSAGELTLDAACEMGPGTFACRTGAPGQSPVAQMASGPADSRLNDSLFDPQQDQVLRFGAQRVIITTEMKKDQPPAYRLRLAATHHTSDSSAISCELIRNYYRDRYVPHYRLIDRSRCPSAPTGWMSWNTYFDKAREQENLEEARVGARYLKPFGLQIWSIESWQDNSPQLPVSNFHNLTLKASAEKFPHGMKWLAQEIRALGFRPGLWCVPWGTGDADFYQAHRDWFLHDTEGKPLANWNGRFLLDPSQSAVREHMEHTCRVMAQDWGYEFFKIDGMSGRGPSYSAHFFERPEVKAAFRQPVEDPFNLCVEALRRGLGPDRIILACAGHYTGPEVTWVDAARSGADIVSPNQPPRWANYLAQARVTLNQLFTHNLIWFNDPDTLLVAEPASLNEARLAATVVALPGQLTFFGDKLGQLPPERMRILQQTLPVCDVHPLDLQPAKELKAIWDLKIRRPFGSWDVVSLFNWDETPRELVLAFATLGLEPDQDYLLYEFWSQRFLGAKREEFSVHVEPHANVLLAVHPQLNRPQFLSTDRHVSQGGVELTSQEWHETSKELVCSFELVENDPLTAVIYCPPSHRFIRAAADGTASASVPDATASIIKVVLQSTQPGPSRLHLQFE